MSTYTVRPLSDHTWLGKRPRIASRFDSDWNSTRALVLAEVRHLRGKNLVLGMDVPESQIRIDGELYANARPSSPAVEVAFESKHGPLIYRCDRYVSQSVSKTGPDWQHNVRAIALTLQALRAVDRYGAAESGEQYAGYRQLASAPAVMAQDSAVTVIYNHAGLEPNGGHTVAEAFRLARRNTHPDLTGQRLGWDQVEEAGKALGLL